MSVVDRILRLPALEEAPPVLVDVGAAQGTHPPWRQLAKYSVCVAFEADERELRASRARRQAFGASRHTTQSQRSKFHLTASPFCFSRLTPRLDSLGRYAFAPLFEVERMVELPALDIPSVLAELGLERVDWLKGDSQGTDLRLFRSLGDLASSVLVAEFEPGIIDAYEGEDKFADVLNDLGSRGFWMSDFRVRGSTRISSELAGRIFGERASGCLDICHKRAPGWAEVEYFNDFEDETLGKRELLIGCAFAFTAGTTRLPWSLPAEAASASARPSRTWERTALRRVKAGFARFPLAALGALGRRAVKR